MAEDKLSRPNAEYFIRFFDASELVVNSLKEITEHVEVRTRADGVVVHSTEIVSANAAVSLIPIATWNDQFSDVDLFVSLYPVFGSEVIEVPDYVSEIVRRCDCKLFLSYTNVE